MEITSHQISDSDGFRCIDNIIFVKQKDYDLTAVTPCSIVSMLGPLFQNHSYPYRRYNVTQHQWPETPR